MRVAASANGELEHGLEILLAHTDQLDSKIFFRRALKLVDRANRSRTRIRDRLSQGIIQRTNCYARALLGQPLDVAMLLEASQSIEVGCQTNYWDDYTQMYYLAAVRASLIAGDVTRAERLFGVRKKFKDNAREFALLKLLVEALSPASKVRIDKLRDRFQSFFDRVRSPRYFPSALTEGILLSFEYGVLWCLYFVSHDRTIDWQQVIESISA
jgi:hypothetical protein